MSGPSVGVIVARHAAQATRTMSASTERPRPRVPSIGRSRTGRTAASGSIQAKRSRRCGSARRPWPIGRRRGRRVAPRRSRRRGVVACPRARGVVVRHMRAASQAEVTAKRKAGAEAAHRAKTASEIVCAPASKAVRRHRVSRVCLRVAGGRN